LLQNIVNDLAFIHRFVPGQSSRTFFLLHGTGGNEDDLLELGHAIDPAAALLSPRGKVLENGAPRFFRRLAEGVFDEADVVHRAKELSAFLKDAIQRYDIEASNLVAVGYSNGANIAAAMLMLGLAQFSRAILFRPMVPLSNVQPMPDLPSVKVQLLAGKFDPIATPPIVGTLAGLFRGTGATVAVEIQPSGHELTSQDIVAAREWLGNSGS
jgi:phospholipase/carboxylesterase